VVEAYDESAGDFMKALFYQLVVKDRRFREACENSAAEFRRRIPSLSLEERKQFRELYWRMLSGSPDVLSRIQREFDSARQRGRLRCWVCDKDSSAYPAAHRWSR